MRNEKKRVYVDLKTDFGFKLCFGDEKRLKTFLNIFLSEDYGKIEKVTFENNELTRERREQRGVTFDLRCTLANGDSVLIEMQNYSQKFFKTRASYYLYTLLDKEVPKGLNWSDMKEDIPRVIGVFLMGKEMNDLATPITRISECNLDTGKEFWNRMRKYYISLPHFQIDYEHITQKDVWIEVIKNLGSMENIDPRVYEVADDALLELIEKAKLSALSAEEYDEYEKSLKEIADSGAAEAYGYEKGKEEGREEGINSAIRLLMESGMPLDDICHRLQITPEKAKAAIV